MVLKGAARVPGLVSAPVVETNQADNKVRDSSVSTAARMARRSVLVEPLDGPRQVPVVHRWGISSLLVAATIGSSGGRARTHWASAKCRIVRHPKPDYRFAWNSRLIL